MITKIKRNGRGETPALTLVSRSGAVPGVPDPFPGNGKAGARPELLETTEHAPLDRIDPNPWQARRDFGEAEIAELAESIRAHGLLQRPVCRKVRDRYQLIAGERRVRACRVAGLDGIFVQVRHDVSDADMRALAFEENAKRKDLNPVERARELQAMLDAGDAAGPTELARILGLSQGQVSNLLGLLRLPEQPWQQRILDGKMSAAHARAIAPWAKYPAVLQELEDAQGDWEEEPPSVEQFREDVGWACRRASKAIDGKDDYCYELHEAVPVFTPTEEERAQLQIEEVPYTYSDGKELRAFNVELWEQLQKAWRKKWIRQRRKEQEREAEEAGAKSVADLKDGGKSGKKAAKEDPEKARGPRTKDAWFGVALRWLIARAMPAADDVAVQRLLLASSGALVCDPLLPQDLGDAFGCRRDMSMDAIARRLWTLDAAELGQAARRGLAGMFWLPDDCPCYSWPDEHLVPVAIAVGVDFEAAWLDGTLQPHYEAWVGLLDDRELSALAKQLKIVPPIAMKMTRKGPLAAEIDREATIEGILAAMPTPERVEMGPPLPKDLAKLWKQGAKGGKR